MIKVNFYKLDIIEDNKLAFAVIMSKFKDKWIYVKHKERCTWEIPGGHREYNESIDEVDELPEFEIEKIKLFDDIPNELTYPLIQPFLHNKVLEFIANNKIKKITIKDKI